MNTLADLNVASPDRFAAALEGVFEHAAWVPLAAAAARPFATVTALHDAMMDVVRQADTTAQLRFLRGHPALSSAAIAAALTIDSATEQAGLALSSLGADATQLTALSAEYAARHGFPFIICARRHTPRSVLRNLERRLPAAKTAERAAALREVFYITRLRLVSRVSGPGSPQVHGRLTTRVVDAARGQAAEGVRVELLREGVPLHDAMTGCDGTTGAPLLVDEPLRIGRYLLRFHVGAYFGRCTAAAADPPWLDEIPVQFNVSSSEADLHVPLLVSPGQYTTWCEG